MFAKYFLLVLLFLQGISSIALGILKSQIVLCFGGIASLLCILITLFSTRRKYLIILSGVIQCAWIILCAIFNLIIEGICFQSVTCRNSRKTTNPVTLQIAFGIFILIAHGILYHKNNQLILNEKKEGKKAEISKTPKKDGEKEKKE